MLAGSLCEYQHGIKEGKSAYMSWYSTTNDPSAKSSPGKGRPTTKPPQLSTEARPFSLSTSMSAMDSTVPFFRRWAGHKGVAAVLGWFVVVVGGGLKARAVEGHFDVAHCRVLVKGKVCDEEGRDKGKRKDDEG